MRANYKPDGMILGMNLGRAAGAGLVGHLHLTCCLAGSGILTHDGDGRTPCMPEDLKTTSSVFPRRCLTQPVCLRRRTLQEPSSATSNSQDTGAAIECANSNKYLAARSEARWT